MTPRPAAGAIRASSASTATTPRGQMGPGSRRPPRGRHRRAPRGRRIEAGRAIRRDSPCAGAGGLRLADAVRVGRRICCLSCLALTATCPCRHALSTRPHRSETLSTMTDSTSVLDRAREAIDRKAWDKAYRLLSEADESRRLDGDALPTLADTAYMAGHPEVAIDAWERVHAAAVRAGEDERGADAAGHVATLLLYTGLLAPARGWIPRAEDLLVDHPDSPVHGQLAVSLPGRPSWPATSTGPCSTRAGPSTSGRGWAFRRSGSWVATPRPASSSSRGTSRRDSRSWTRPPWRSVVRGARPREHRTPVLQHGVRVPGAVRVRPSRGMDQRHGAMVPSARDGRLPRLVPRPPRRDPSAPRGLGRRRGRGSGGVRGAPQVLTDRRGLGVGGARTDPPADWGT